MRVEPVRTKRLRVGQMSITDVLDSYLPPKVGERTIVALASKVVSLCEGRLVPSGAASKDELIKRESQRYLAQRNPYGFTFTITNGTLVPSAGIDESNTGGGYLLWPADPQATANSVREHLQARFELEHVGALITDSTCSPLTARHDRDMPSPQRLPRHKRLRRKTRLVRATFHSEPGQRRWRSCRDRRLGHGRR